MIKIFIYVILLAGFGNTVLRTEIENPITLYRVLAPLGLLIVLFHRPVFAMKGLACFALFALYSLMLAVSYSNDFSQFIPSLIHYLYLFIVLLLLAYMKSTYGDFDASFMRFFTGFYIFLWASLAIEFAFGFTYPNLYEDPEPQLRAFYWNQNDLAVVLCAVAWIVMTDDRYRTLTRMILVSMTVGLLYYNDSKAALISLVFISVPIALVFAIASRVRLSVGVWSVGVATACFMVVLATVAVLNTELPFSSEKYTLSQLFYEPILRIVNLEVTGETWGSLNNRTDAAISVLIEYFKTFGFGLGPGGSWLVLTFPEYVLGGAASPHNALLQFTVDFGLPVLLGYLYLVVWAIRRLFRHVLDYPTRIKVMAILSFPLLGLSQSGAIVTNYAFFTLVVFITLLGRPQDRISHSAQMVRKNQPFPVFQA